MALRDRRKPSVRARQADDAELAGGLVAQRHVDAVLVAPEAEQSPVLRGKTLDGGAPSLFRHDGAQPRTVMRDFMPLLDQRGEREGARHGLP